MNQFRKIKKTIQGLAQKDGAGVNLQRVIGFRDTQDFDPFLMLDFFDSRNPEDYVKGFPWHPHRGIETITYLISGSIEHQDSLGNGGIISDSSCQWMTAGSGILHQEMPLSSPYMLGIQLWLNLPAKDKMCPPAYHEIKSSDIMQIQEESAQIRLISGSYKGNSSNNQGEYIKATIIDCSLDKNSNWEYISNQEDNLFIFLISGYLLIDNASIHPKTAVLFDSGAKIHVQSDEHPARFLIFSGKALNEGIAWGGPIVMNTREELNLAFKELENGTFIK